MEHDEIPTALDLSWGLRPQTPSWRRALLRIGLEEDSDLSVGRLAAQLAAAGERGAAADAYRELVEASPGDAEALDALADVLARLGRMDEEIAIRRRSAAITAEDLGVPKEHREAAIDFELATMGLAAIPPFTPPAVVEATFDAFADTYDERLREMLSYAAPELCAARLERAFGAGDAALDICDAGCGTGLLGPLLRPFARTLDGIDLSPRMLDRARSRAVYDTLVEGDISDQLAQRRQTYDVITAADVFVYIGDLRPVLVAMADALREGGLLVFTVERGYGDSYQLTGAARYAHAADFIRAATTAAGLDEISIEDEVLRMEQGTPVNGLVCAFRKAA